MKLPAIYRLTQHTVSKRWGIEVLMPRDKCPSTWEHVQDVLCEGGWSGRTFLFKWWAKIVMYNMICAEIERVTYENGTWEEK